MPKKNRKFRIGLRTIKTAAAVVISLILVNTCGTTSSKLIFAMLGAMAAMEPTFKESLKACMTQTIGMLLGAIVGVLLIQLPIPPLAAAGIGIVLVITLYNALNIRFSPSLPCLIVVTLCTTPDIQPITYAIGRFWDTAIGLLIGLFINSLIFPYDNRSQLRITAESLDHEVILFLEDMFDGDNKLPDTQKMSQMIDNMNKQLTILSNQWILLHLKGHRKAFEDFNIYKVKTRELIAHMEVLCRMDYPGILNDENRKRLQSCGADVCDKRIPMQAADLAIVTNYHLTRLLDLRQELLQVLS